MPVFTLIMTQPGENVDDLIKTLELIDDLKDYRLMFYPLLLVHTGRSADEDYAKEALLPEHFKRARQAFQDR